MSRIFKKAYTVPVPPNCIVKDKKVNWTNKKGKRCAGKLSADGQRVLIESPKWVITFKDENNHSVTISTNTNNRDAAQRILLHRENEVTRIKSGIATRSEIDIANKKVTNIEKLLESYKCHFMARDVSEGYLKYSMFEIKRICDESGVTDIRQLNTAVIEHWIATNIKSGERSNATINSYIKRLSQFFNWCVDQNIVLASPVRRIKSLNPDKTRRRKRRAYSDDELDLLLKQGYDQDQRDLYHILVTTGLRVSELLSIQVKQFDLDKQIYTIFVMRTKNRKEGRLPLRDDTVETIKQIIARKKLTLEDNLFGKFVEKSTRQVYYKRFLKDLKRLGIPRYDDMGKVVDLHAFRKTFGTMLARAGVPLTTTQKLMRHSDPRITAQYYIEVTEMDMGLALEKIPLK